MRRTSVIIFAFFLQFVCVSRAQDTDPIATSLDKAKKVYETSEDAYREKVLNLLQVTEDRATKAGMKKVVDQIEAEREAFSKDGTLPKSVNTSDLRVKRDRARRVMIAAYNKAIEDYTKKRLKSEANAVEAELANFTKVAPNRASPNDTFLAGSIWVGPFTRVVNGEMQVGGTYKLTVISRNDDTFKARAELLPNVVFEANGTIKGNHISWKTKNSVKIVGHAGHDYEGTLIGNRLELTYSGLAMAAGGQPVSGVVNLERTNVKTNR